MTGNSGLIPGRLTSKSHLHRFHASSGDPPGFYSTEMGVKGTGREAEYSGPSSVKVTPRELHPNRLPKSSLGVQ
jgi:hypothetical protein